MPAPPAPPQITGLGYLRPLGRGGFAHVHLYEQDMPRRQVAVKVLGEGIETARSRSAFATEADAMARLSSHPSIVSVYQVGVSTSGQLYIAMEYCPDSMRERTRGNPAHLRTVLDAGVRLAGALETAHRAGVLHRDVKPSNVLITATGRPALTDFGIASLYGRDAFGDAARALSLPWAAPEVLIGDSSGTVASEIWSLAASLYTFAAGHSPFESPDPQQNTQSKMTARIKKARYVPVPGAAGYEPFDALMGHAMNLAPEGRFPTMREFAEALQRAQRYFGFDVTPLDITPLDATLFGSADNGSARKDGAQHDTHEGARTAEGDATPLNPDAPVATRGPTVSTVRANSRAQARAEQAALSANRDGVLPDRPVSPIRAGLIGAGIAVVAVAGIIAAAFALGWV